MMLRHLEDRGIQAVGLPALEYMRTDKQAEPDEAYIQAHLSELIDRAPSGTQLFITEAISVAMPSEISTTSSVGVVTTLLRSSVQLSL